MLHHGGKVHVLDVVVPVDHSWIEAERLLVGGVKGVPQSEQVVDAVDGFALGVETVELHVFECALDLAASFFKLGAPCGLRATQGQGLQHAFRAIRQRLGTRELLLNATAAGEVPVGHHDGLALGVVDRVCGEPVAHVVDQPAVSQWIAAARGNLRDVRGAFGAGGGHGDDCGHHDVDGDHVDRALGDAGELAQQTAGVRDDHRLGHAEATDPTWLRLGNC
jgi:hypothetical protein